MPKKPVEMNVKGYRIAISKIRRGFHIHFIDTMPRNEALRLFEQLKKKYV